MTIHSISLSSGIGSDNLTIYTASATVPPAPPQTPYPGPNQWAVPATWGKTVPTPTAGQLVYASTGLVNAGATLITWSAPILFNTGVLSVSWNGAASASGAVSISQAQSDWNAVSGVTAIANKPTIPAAQVPSNWNATSGVSAILNKPTIPAAQIPSDWNATSGVTAIANKPTIPAAQVPSDWNAVSGVSAIANKPTVPPVTKWLDQSTVLTYGTTNGGTEDLTLVSGNYVTRDSNSVDWNIIVNNSSNAPTQGTSQIWSAQTPDASGTVLKVRSADLNGSSASVTNFSSQTSVPAGWVLNGATATFDSTYGMKMVPTSNNALNLYSSIILNNSLTLTAGAFGILEGKSTDNTIIRFVFTGNTIGNLSNSLRIEVQLSAGSTIGTVRFIAVKVDGGEVPSPTTQNFDFALGKVFEIGQTATSYTLSVNNIVWFSIPIGSVVTGGGSLVGLVTRFYMEEVTVGVPTVLPANRGYFLRQVSNTVNTSTFGPFSNLQNNTPVTTLPRWSNLTTYEIGDIVGTDTGTIAVSLMSNNTGNSPTAVPTSWRIFSVNIPVATSSVLGGITTGAPTAGSFVSSFDSFGAAQYTAPTGIGPTIAEYGWSLNADPVGNQGTAGAPDYYIFSIPANYTDGNAKTVIFGIYDPHPANVTTKVTWNVPSGVQTQNTLRDSLKLVLSTAFPLWSFADSTVDGEFWMSKTNTTSSTIIISWVEPTASAQLGIRSTSTNASPPTSGAFFLRSTMTNANGYVIGCSRRAITKPTLGLRSAGDLTLVNNQWIPGWQEVGSALPASRLRLMRMVSGATPLSSIPSITVEFNTDGGRTTRVIISAGS